MVVVFNNSQTSAFRKIDAKPKVTGYKVKTGSRPTCGHLDFEDSSSTALVLNRDG